MYGKTATGATLALTPGATYSTTGSIVLAGVALILAGFVIVIASRMRRKHDDSVLDK